MLSNKDFAQLLASGGGGKDEGKVRFDMKQIKQWDQQNKAKFKNKVSNEDKVPKTQSESSKSEKDESEQIYRDRAEERRKDANPDYDIETVEALSKLDAEKTQFLGGDVDHTHLVKGLDYTLLKKIRNQVEVQTKSVLDDKKQTAENNQVVVAVSELGNRIKQLFFPTTITEPINNNLAKDVQILSTQQSKPTTSLFARMVYDFDVNPISEEELPTTISKSKKEEIINADMMSFVADPALLLKLNIAIENSKVSKKMKKKVDTISSIYDQAPSASSVSSKKLLIDPVGDIFEDVGKYVPAEVVSERKSVDATAAVGSRGYFSQLRATADEEAVVSEDAGMSQEDIMASVNKALAAQATKERMKHEMELKRLEAAADGARSKPEEEDGMEVENGVVHRDVIGGMLDVPSAKRGNAMGRGTYELYPENADFETYDSDEDDAKKPVKGSGAGGGTKSSGSTAVGGGSGATTKKPKAVSGNGGGGNTSGGGDGLNRAARRAAARGEDKGKASKKPRI